MMLWVVSVTFYVTFLYTLLVIVTRNMAAPLETGAVSFAEFRSHLGNGDLLLVRTPTMITTIIEKNLQS